MSTALPTPYVASPRRPRPRERVSLTQLTVAYALWPAALALWPLTGTFRGTSGDAKSLNRNGRRNESS